MESYKYFAVLLLAASVVGNHTSGVPAPEPRFAHNFNNTSVFTRVIPSSNVSTHDAIYVTPALFFVGDTNGDIRQCLHDNPSVCEMYYVHHNTDDITAIVIHGEYLFASVSGLMLKCNLHQARSCTTFNNVGTQINCLTIAAGYIHAGLSDGRILRCDLHKPNCKTLNTMPNSVTSLGATDRYLYTGLSTGTIWRCSIAAENSCRSIHTSSEGESIGMSAKDETVLAFIRGGYIWNCTRDFTCVRSTIPNSGYTSAMNFDGSLYGRASSDLIYICGWGATMNCSQYDTHKGALSISFSYSTYKLQDRYVNEEKTCVFGGQCPPFMFYYEANQRPMLEVFVRYGKLYNSQGVLVDTRKADFGRSGRAAIFAMGPDGQILLSNVHNSVLQTSSLFAGQPVAGVGEIAVEDGVIRHMMACSDHYRPDTELNKQVIKVLQMKGYTASFDNLPCCKGNECAQLDQSNNECGQVIVEEN